MPGELETRVPVPDRLVPILATGYAKGFFSIPRKIKRPGQRQLPRL